MKTKFTLFSLIAVVIASFIMGFSNPGDRTASKNTARTNITGSYSYTYTPLPNNELDASALSESFENTTFPPAGWTRIKFGATDVGWTRMTVGTTPLPGWNGGTITAPPGGGNAVAFVTYNLNVPSNREWLITPQLTNMQPGDSLSFWRRFWPSNVYSDTLSVLISTTTPTPAAFTILVARIPFARNSVDTNWTRHGYNIGGLVTPGANIYVGFLEHVLDNFNDGATVSLDLVNVTANTTGITPIGSEIPSVYSLSQNYPNPFNPSTSFKFGIPDAGIVNLTVYDISGREVANIVNGFFAAGNYNVSFDASSLSTGVYFYRLTTNSYTDTKKMMLIK